MARRRNLSRFGDTAGHLAPYLVFAALLGTTWLVMWGFERARDSA